jgi:hypothetical protein
MSVTDDIFDLDEEIKGKKKAKVYLDAIVKYLNTLELQHEECIKSNRSLMEVNRILSHELEQYRKR